MFLKAVKLVSKFYCRSVKVFAHNEYEYKNYLDQGYSLVDKLEDYPARMARNARLIVIVRTDDREEFSFDAKAECCRLYGKKKISPQLAERFEADVKEGKVKLYTDGVSLFCENA